MSSAARSDRRGNSLDSALASAKEALGVAPDNKQLEDASLKLEQGIAAARRKVKESLTSLPDGRMILKSELAALEALGRENGIELEELLPGVKQIKSWRIVDLSLQEKGLSSITALSELGGLKILSVSSNRLTSLQGIEGLASLRELYAYNNLLTTLRGVERLASLKELYASDNQLTTLQDVGGLVGLRYFRVMYNMLTDLQGVEGLTDLKELSVSGNPLSKEAKELAARFKARGVKVDV